MKNFFEVIQFNPGFKKIDFESLTLVEYNCPITADILPVWTPHDVFVHCLSGKKTWQTCDTAVTITKGQTLFVAKGAQIVNQSFEEEFCLLMIFIKEEFKESTRFNIVREYQLGAQNFLTLQSIESDPILQTFFLSLLSLLASPKTPSKKLIELKLFEFVHLLAQQEHNKPILEHLFCGSRSIKDCMHEIMLHNYMYDMQLADYAELCNKSLSSFKRIFLKHFGVSPGKWLTDRRMERAVYLLMSTADSISQVAFACGYEDPSHFSRVFKRELNTSPMSYRSR